MTRDEELAVVAQMAATLGGASPMQVTAMRAQSVAEDAWALFYAVRRRQNDLIAAERPEADAPPPIQMR